MCIIFHEFPTEEAARDFGRKVQAEYGLRWSYHADQESSSAEDYFPWELTPPIVLVQRADEFKEDGPFWDSSKVEEAVEALVTEYGGKYAGT